MSFTGKATYSAGTALPEIAEDVSDLVAINSPHATPLLDALGDPLRVARSTVHDWLEDSLLPNVDTIDEDSFSPSPTLAESFGVANADRFRAGDQVRGAASDEIMLVTAIDAGSGTITVQREYGGTTAEALADEQTLHILCNAALEGDDASAARFTARSRVSNYTQIFTATIEVSGSEQAVRQIAVNDELDYQKHQRLREMLRELEDAVINSVAPGSSNEGSATVRRTMRGLQSFIMTNRFAPGVGGFPAGATLTEEQLNAALRAIWQSSSGNVDLIVVGGQEKRAINQFVASNRRYAATGETFKDAVSVYESDFGVCRVVLSRSVPAGTVMLLDSSRIDVLPLAGRSFQYRPLARTGDRESGQIVGEYTLELRNENAHGMIEGLS